MTEKYVKRIRTADGDLQIDYNALANLPEIPVVDTELNAESNNAVSNSVVCEEIGDINSALEEIITLQEELLIPDGNEVAY